MLSGGHIPSTDSSVVDVQRLSFCFLLYCLILRLPWVLDLESLSSMTHHNGTANDEETRPLLNGHSQSYQSTPPGDGEPSPAKKPSNDVSKGDLAWVLAGLWSAVFLGALDGSSDANLAPVQAELSHAFAGTIVATLLTPIGSYFNKSNQASYIGTSYLLSVCCFTPLYGRLSDILGRKGAMLLALSLFGGLCSLPSIVALPDGAFLGVGTICCGIAPSMETLIAARAVAGMGGGGCVYSLSTTS